MAGLNGTANGVVPTPPDAPRTAADNSGRGDDEKARPVDPRSAATAEAQLSAEVSVGYRPLLPVYSTNAEHLFSPQFFLDIEPMRLHPAIHLPLMYRLGAVAHPEWKVEGSDPDVVQFGTELVQWFWAHAVSRLYEEGCCYGFAAGEVVYELRDGLLRPKVFKPFSSRGVQPLVDTKHRPVGVMVQSTYGSEAYRLWGFREDVPNKSVWYTHNSSYGGRFGRSALRPVWRAWRRLSGRDGAEEIADLAMYRYGTGFVKTFYPPVDQKVGAATRPPAADSSGRVSGRDTMRMIGEQIKAGGAINLPSVFQGDKRVWDVEFETPSTNLQDILAYLDALESMCAKGLGVPPELIEAAETGSGYSGRMIPLEAFLTEQQQYVSDLTRTFEEQLAGPCARWNFGPKAWLRVIAKPLTETFKKRAGQASGPQRDPSGHFAPLPQQQPPQPPQPGVVGMATDGDLAATLPHLTLSELRTLEAELEAGDE